MSLADTPLRTFIWQPLLCALCLCPVNCSAEVTHWFRFEPETGILRDSVGDVVLESVGEPVGVAALPTVERGHEFPTSFANVGENTSSANFTADLGGLEATGAASIEDDFSVELLFNGSEFERSTWGVHLVTQAFPSFTNPTDFGWTLHVRRDTWQGAVPNELVLVLSNGDAWEAIKSRILVEENTDYSIRADVDLNQGVASFHVFDLAERSMRTTYAPYAQGGLNASDWVLIGDLPTWTDDPSRFPTTGLIDEVRISKGLLSHTGSLLGQAILADGSQAHLDEVILGPRSIFRPVDTDSVTDLLGLSTTTLHDDSVLSKFVLPDVNEGDTTLEKATLQFYVSRLIGETEMPELSLWHSASDNDLEVDPGDIADPSYEHTGELLFSAGVEVGRYLDVDVTDLVRGNYSQDAGIAVAAFQVRSVGGFRLSMPGSVGEPPQLKLTFRLPGDFNRDGVLDAHDIDLLTAGANDLIFDLNLDGVIDEIDRDVWVHHLKNTWYGDANLDGEFSSTDFVHVFQRGKYETDQEAGWSEGDWDGDSLFSSGDFVTAFQDGGYERGPRVEVAAVPEPSGVLLLVTALIGLAIGRRQA